MTEQGTEQPKKRGAPQKIKIPLAEKIFLEDCKNRQVSPIVLKRFPKVKMVSERSQAIKVLCLTQDHYKNIIEYIAGDSRRYVGETTGSKPIA